MKLNKLTININNQNTYSFGQIDVKNIDIVNDCFYFVIENENKFSDEFLNGLCLDKILTEGFEFFIYYLNGNQYETQKKRLEDFLKKIGLI